MKKMLALLTVSALTGILAFSCSTSDQLTDPAADPGTTESVSLEKEFGGYSTSDEPAAFGNSDLLAESSADQVVSDTYAADTEVIQALSTDAVTDSSTAAAIKAYFLRITFGLLEGDSTATEVIDWSGSAEVNKGTLVVLKTIRFEDNDAIQLPRTSRQLVEFTAQTKPHFDGMVLAVIDNDTTDQEGTFTFTAGSYSKTFSFSELDSLESLDPVGSNGHQVSILSRSKEYVPFAGGFITGHWIKSERHGGTFRGRWINSLGTNAGHLRGIWGINRNGRKVFKGKYINFNGEFRGLIAGVWNYEQGENGGTLRGRWVNRNHDTTGILKGKFRAGRPGDHRGFFHARYRKQNHD